MPLPVPSDTMRVRMRATLGTGATPQDEAQFGFWGVREHRAGNSVDWPADVDEVATKIRDAWSEKAVFTDLFPTSVKMDAVYVDHLDAANGKTLDQGVAPFTGTKVWQGLNANSLPWETSTAVSLYGYGLGEFTTNKARKRGRFYLPPMAPFALGGPSGQVSSGTLDQIMSSVADFLNEVQGLNIGSSLENPAGADYFDLRVISRGTPTKPLPPTSTQIIRVTIDSKVDSQRRRERQQDATAAVSRDIDRN